MASTGGGPSPGGAPGGRGHGLRGWTFEDAVPGSTLRHPGGRTIGEAEHVWLAWLTHNLSDVHGDAHAAASGPWGRPLVLGMLSVAIVMGLAEPAASPPEAAGADMPGGWSRITLGHPVVAGDTLTAESHIQRAEPAAAGEPASHGRVARTIVGRIQTGQEVVRIDEERLVPRHEAWHSR